MHISTILKMCISFLGVLLLGISVVQQDETAMMLLIVGSIFCALIPHMLHKGEPKVSEYDQVLLQREPAKKRQETFDDVFQHNQRVEQQKQFQMDMQKRQILAERKRKVEEYLEKIEQEMGKPKPYQAVETVTDDIAPEEPMADDFVCYNCKHPFTSKSALIRHISKAECEKNEN